MEILRTPESCFDNLPGFSYTPRYFQYGDIRMAYIDEVSTLPGAGSSEKTEVFLCLHGEPTWQVSSCLSISSSITSQHKHLLLTFLIIRTIECKQVIPLSQNDSDISQL